jgi:hypothetical protein
MELSFNHDNGEVDIIKEKQALKVLDDITRQALIPMFSQVLVEQGYRKESDTAREILAEIDDLTLCIIDGNNEFEKGYFQAIADIKKAIKDLLKEKYEVE